MRRPRWPRVVLLLMLGLATCVAVAVVCALFPPTGNGLVSRYFRHGTSIACISEARSVGFRDYGWFVHIDDDVPDFVEKGLATDPAHPPPYWTTFWKPGTIEHVRRAQTRNSGMYPTQQDLGAGWPFIAFRAYRNAVPSSQPPVPSPLVGAIEAGHRLFPMGPNAFFQVDRRIPYLPVWPGLLADTLAFALVWWIVGIALARWTSARRARRGLCPRCAYDLRATPPDRPCPECGRTRP